ncbi:MAG: hypothetical protein KC516_00490 [Nanoarchaeota archaeon]|nr:hypothetical protein [Nanoarchaeota archaeon]
MLNNKKAQLGETLTWVVATILILVILFFFVFGSSLLGKTKDIKVYREKLTSISENSNNLDYFLSKTLYTYFQFENSKQKADFREILFGVHPSEEFLKSFDARSEEIKKRGGFK